MEKNGAVTVNTPTEREDVLSENVKSASDRILELDADFRKRAAETVVRAKPAK